MDITSYLITIVLTALMLYLLVRLPLAIHGNLRAGHRFRQGLAAALDGLRLSRMLRYLGIDQAEYLHKQPALDVQTHIERCEACDAKSECDQVLQDANQSGTGSLGFCANIDDLKTIRGSH